MKNFVLKIIYGCGTISSYVFTKRVSSVGKFLYATFYNGWLRPQLGHIGENTKASFPLHLSNGKHICIGSNVFLGGHISLQATTVYNGQKYTPSITIGNSCIIQNEVVIAAIGTIRIGNHVAIGSRTFISDACHGEVRREEMDSNPVQRPLYSKGGITIEDYVWIGIGCVIMPGIHIGKGAIVGSNSVVTKDIPDYAVAAGCPAKILRQYEE